MDNAISLKSPATIDEEIEKLHGDGMIIQNRKRASRYLQQIGYYTFKGYADLLKNEEDNDYAGISFEDVVTVYEFDVALRSLLAKYLLMLEEYMRALIADRFALAHCLDPPHDQHYETSNFYNASGVSEILCRIDDSRFYDDYNWKQHHSQKYGGRYPLWVMVRMMSFTTLSKLYSYMWNHDKDKISAAVGTSSKNLANQLHCLSLLRNQCMHLNRLIGGVRNKGVELPHRVLRKWRNLKRASLFAYMLALVMRLPTNQEKDAYIEDMTKVLKDFEGQLNLMDLIGAPSDYENIINCCRGRVALP